MATFAEFPAPTSVAIPTLPCAVCGKASILDVPLEAAQARCSGATWSEAWPEGNPDLWELLISGTHPACWEILTGGEEA